MKEYIGITGYKYMEEINEARKAYESAGINRDSEIGTMFGFLVSEKQAFDNSIESRRNPSLRNLDGLLREVPSWMMPTLHYCSRSRELDVDNLLKILDYKSVGFNTQAVQLNLDWPSEVHIAALKLHYPNLYIIQQVNPNFPGVDAVSRVMEYEGLVDKLLIDPSLGAGISYDISQSAEIINRISEKTDKFSFVICGGLDKENVYDKVLEARRFVNPSFSIDAEGRLRTFDGTRLDLEKTESYILNSAKAMLR